MDIARFIAVQRGSWDRLGELLDRAESKGLDALTPAEVNELFRLYRLASADLNRAQTATSNPGLLDYLESLVGRAYFIISPPRRARPFRAWWHALRYGFVAVFRREKWAFALAGAALLAGAGFGWFATAADPRLTVVFLPAEHLVQTPAERVAELEELERSGSGQIGTFGAHAVFSSFLFTHNIRVSILAFALGLTFGIGTVVVLFYNGVILGSIAYNYVADGQLEFFAAWIGPHGSIELPCIVFAGGAGLIVARAQWARTGGVMTRRIASVRGDLLPVLVGAATLLVVAGLIEGGFSQVNEPTIPYPLKIGVAAMLFVLLCAYLFVMPIRGAERVSERSAAGDGSDELR